jgi:hypothetical protein
VIRTLFIVVFSALLQITFAQNKRIQRVFKNSDTCHALQVISKINNLSVQNRLMLLEEYMCIKEEKIALRKGFTWLSFPRLTGSNPSVNSVIGGDNIVPNNPPDIYYQAGSYLENLPLGNEANSYIYNTYNGSIWNPDGFLYNIDSKSGYKLKLKYNTDPNQDIKLHLHGNLLPSDATIDTIYGNNKENWIGYWLYQEQDIFDALGSTADDLNLIKHQDWTCVYTKYPATNPTGGDSTTIQPKWYCDTRYPIVKYGEMVILKGENDILGFQWNLFGNPPSSREDLSPEHYSYQEQEDYKPVTIELDSGDHPQEIGAFAGDSCIGATALAADDTMTVIRAYVENDNDTITFQKYYGTKSTGKHIVNNYYIYTPRLKGWQKGPAVNNKNIDRFFVSFKKKKTIKPGAVHNSNPILSIYPNPARNNLTIGYATGNENIYFEVFDVTGKKVLKLNEHHHQGLHSSIINTQNLKNGIYLLKLSTTKQTGVKRFVIKR